MLEATQCPRNARSACVPYFGIVLSERSARAGLQRTVRLGEWRRAENYSEARSGANLIHVPFRGGGPAMNDLVAGHVPSVIASAPTATGFMREGRIRALAVTGARRSPFDPDIPTIAEQGFPGYAATNWYAAVVSSKVPPEIAATLNAILTRALNAPEVREAYGQQGMETLASTQAEAAAHIARETEIWKKVIADAGIRLE